MAYFAPYIDAAGFHIPTYSDILNDLIASAQLIFGNDIYLGDDSQDYQMISAFASKINDAFLTAQIAYNNQRVDSAMGVGLASLVKINGLAPALAVYSTAIVNIVGTAGTVINNGVINDQNNIAWNMPASVSIGVSGIASVTVVCSIAGAIAAIAGSISNIATPTYGWLSASNPADAIIGVNAETDSQLRIRQASSAALPSRTIREGLKAAIAAISGVTRSDVLENDTSAIDSNGIAAHSICAIIEGGADADIASAIFYKKGPGCGTYGDVSQNIVDSYGVTNVVHYKRVAYADVDVKITIHKLTGYTDYIGQQIQINIFNYLNSLGIGNTLTVSSLWIAAISAMSDLTHPTFSITSVQVALHGNALGTIDIPIAFNQVTRGNAGYITLVAS